MKWQLTAPHYLNEQVLPAGTIIGDDTPYPYRSNHTDYRIGRKKGDHLPPSTDMIPLDDEARQAHQREFGGEPPPGNPEQSIPLTSGPDSPRVPGVAPQPQAQRPQEPVNQPPRNETPATGMSASASAAKPPLSPSTPQPQPKPELQKPPGHDSSKNPGDSKDTETAKAPDIKKL